MRFWVKPTRKVASPWPGYRANGRRSPLAITDQCAYTTTYLGVLPPNCAFLVRTAGDPHSLFNALRRQVLAVDDLQPAGEMWTLRELLAAPSWPTRGSARYCSLCLRSWGCCWRAPRYDSFAGRRQAPASAAAVPAMQGRQRRAARRCCYPLDAAPFRSLTSAFISW
jgi:hypothetical protein